MNLKTLFEVIHESMETSSANEIKSACELIITVQGLSGGERDTLRAAVENGPLFDGDVPSKTARDSLNNLGYMTNIVVRGEDGFNACTQKGFYAYKILQALPRRPSGGIPHP